MVNFLVIMIEMIIIGTPDYFLLPAQSPHGVNDWFQGREPGVCSFTRPDFFNASVNPNVSHVHAQNHNRSKNFLLYIDFYSYLYKYKGEIKQNVSAHLLSTAGLHTGPENKENTY